MLTLVAGLALGGRFALAAGPAEKTVYGPEELQAFRANHAEELLQRIPGAASILDASDSNAVGNQRGLGGSGPQILINGRRIASKANDLAAYLRRIDASQVERIELLRDAADGLDVASLGIVVNVVLKSKQAARNGKLLAELNSNANNYGRHEYDGLLSYSGALGGAALQVSAERNVRSPYTFGPVRYSNRSRAENYYFPSGVLQELRPQEWNRDIEKYIYRVELSSDNDANGTWHVNASREQLNFNERAETPFMRFDIAGTEILQGKDIQHRLSKHRSNSELGADYQSNIGAGELKLISILAEHVLPLADLRDRIIGDRVFELNRSDIRQKTREAILRGSYSLPAFGQKLELGAEAARNQLKQQTVLAGDLDGDGRAENIAIPQPDATVTEMRGEMFAKLNSRLGEKLNAEASLTSEFSRITSSYALYAPRQYFFLKPRLDIRYALNARDQIGLLLERKVSQLQFENFVPAYDVLSNRLLAGNPGIAPETSNNLELRFEHQLAADAGNLEVVLYHEAISDAIDRAVNGTDARGNLFSAPTNIGSAKAYGAELKFSLRLDGLGARHALLSGRFKTQTTRITDPFTALPRQIRARWPQEFEVGFRQDLSRFKVSYGADLHMIGGKLEASEILVRETLKIGPRYDAFVEKKVGTKLTLRLEAQHVGGANETRARTIFSDNQIAGTVLRRETYVEKRDRRYLLKVRVRF